MFEIICISTSCKQAENFIKYLSEKLDSFGIENIKIDRKNIRLKTDKFIVSAVDIFGGKLGLSHQMTMYYIDMVSSSTSPRYVGRSYALERLRKLKRTFREGTKEISEEELIEILKEEKI